MPHFTLDIGADGPMVNAGVSVSAARLKALTDSGQVVPPPVKIRALIDTGASCTCLDPTVLASLGLSPTGSASVVTAGGVPESRDQYDISLAIPGATGNEPPLLFPVIPVVATPLLAAQGFHALIGRDILGQCILYYNGDGAFFTLAY